MKSIIIVLLICCISDEEVKFLNVLVVLLIVMNIAVKLIMKSTVDAIVVGGLVVAVLVGFVLVGFVLVGLVLVGWMVSVLRKFGTSGSMYGVRNDVNLVLNSVVRMVIMLVWLFGVIWD